MDTFIDKLAQKLSTSDSAKTNNQTYDQEIKKLKEKIAAYENLLSEIRQVNELNTKSAKELEVILAELKGGQAAPQADMTELTNRFSEVNDYIHTENVKVYRNVQAVVNEGLDKQTESLKESISEEIDGSIKPVNTISIIIMILLIADVAMNICRIFGLF